MKIDVGNIALAIGGLSLMFAMRKYADAKFSSGSGNSSQAQASFPGGALDYDPGVPSYQKDQYNLPTQQSFDIPKDIWTQTAAAKPITTKEKLNIFTDSMASSKFISGLRA